MTVVCYLYCTVCRDCIIMYCVVCKGCVTLGMHCFNLAPLFPPGYLVIQSLFQSFGNSIPVPNKVMLETYFRQSINLVSILPWSVMCFAEGETFQWGFVLSQSSWCGNVCSCFSLSGGLSLRVVLISVLWMVQDELMRKVFLCLRSASVEPASLTVSSHLLSAQPAANGILIWFGFFWRNSWSPKWYKCPPASKGTVEDVSSRHVDMWGIT